MSRGLALRVERLGCARGGRWLFRDVSFALLAGQALALRGPNGSGKSSLLRQLAGLLPVERGIVEGLERPRDVAYLAHQNGLSLDLTARENLALSTRLAGRRPRAEALETSHETSLETSLETALDDAGLRRVAGVPVRRLSQGQRRRLALARVRLSGRPLWLLDEPTAALDADGERGFSVLLARHLEAGGLAVVATHHALDLPMSACVPFELGAVRGHPALEAAAAAAVADGRLGHDHVTLSA